VKARESGPVSYSIEHLASVASLLQEWEKDRGKTVGSTKDKQITIFDRE